MTARGAIVEKGLVGRKAIGDYLSNEYCSIRVGALARDGNNAGKRSYKGYFFAAALTLR